MHEPEEELALKVVPCPSSMR